MHFIRCSDSHDYPANFSAKFSVPHLDDDSCELNGSELVLPDTDVPPWPACGRQAGVFVLVADTTVAAGVLWRLYGRLRGSIPLRLLF